MILSYHNQQWLVWKLKNINLSTREISSETPPKASFSLIKCSHKNCKNTKQPDWYRKKLEELTIKNHKEHEIKTESHENT